MSQEEKLHHLNLEAKFGDMSAEDVIKCHHFRKQSLNNAAALLNVANTLVNAKDHREAQLPPKVRSMLKEQQEIVDFFNDLYRPYLENESLGQLHLEYYLEPQKLKQEREN